MRESVAHAAARPPRWLWIAAWAGIAVRVVVCLASTGSNDIRGWELHGRAIREHGLAALYRTDAMFNHPPLMGAYGAAVSALADRLSVPFPVLFKLPMIAADSLVLVLLWRCATDASGRRTGAKAGLVWGWAPGAILISAFHGNTDPLCAALTLASVVLVVHARRPLAGGLAIAAAMNVKLIPVLVAPAVLVLNRDRRAMARFAAGAAVGAVPFAIAAIDGGEAMVRNVFGWSGMPELWGPFGVLRPLGHRLSGTAPWAPAAVEAAACAVRYAIVLSAIGLAVRARRTGRRLDVRLPALVMMTFLLLAPGFGIQWVHHLAPLLLIADLTAGAVFACVSGAFLVAVYSGFVVSWAPLTTTHEGRFSVPAALLGAVTWLTLAALFIRLWRRPAANANAGCT